METVTKHPKLREGYEFRPRFYPAAMSVQKKERRKLLGLAPSKQGKAPLPARVRKALKAKRRRERLVKSRMEAAMAAVGFGPR